MRRSSDRAYVMPRANRHAATVVVSDRLEYTDPATGRVLRLDRFVDLNKVQSMKAKILRRNRRKEMQK